MKRSKFLMSLIGIAITPVIIAKSKMESEAPVYEVNLDTNEVTKLNPVNKPISERIYKIMLTFKDGFLSYTKNKETTINSDQGYFVVDAVSFNKFTPEVFRREGAINYVKVFSDGSFMISSNIENEALYSYAVKRVYLNIDYFPPEIINLVINKNI